MARSEKRTTCADCGQPCYGATRCKACNWKASQGVRPGPAIPMRRSEWRCDKDGVRVREITADTGIQGADQLQ
jgi:hypothetical protein